jgi:threonine/homoserine/homoserine lactone efflux protein
MDSKGHQLMNQETMLAVAGLVTAGAITPGPNNFIVLRAASRQGVAGALPAIAGVVLGGLGLLAVVAGGGLALFASFPGLRQALVIAGALYLAGLGFALVLASFREPAKARASAGGPAGLASLAAFQFANPKAWILAMTATAAMPPGAHGLAQLAGLFVAIPVACLLLWALGGALLQRALERPRARAGFERAMGALLLASSLFLLL